MGKGLSIHVNRQEDYVPVYGSSDRFPQYKLL